VPTLTNPLKCDEEKPSCQNCQRRLLSCSFLKYIPIPFPSYNKQAKDTQQFQLSSPDPSITSKLRLLEPENSIYTRILTPHLPGIALSSFPLQFSTLDLKLLHFYTTKTSHEILGSRMTGTNIWQTSVVAIAFHQPFLLSALFSLSALHLVHLHSEQDTALGEQYNRIATAYNLRCISQFQVEIQHLTSENSDACCACALQMALHAWTMPGGQGTNLFFPITEPGKEKRVPWYKLHRGGVEVLKFAIHWVEGGELGDLIRPWKATFRTLNLLPGIDNSDVDQEKLKSIESCWNQGEFTPCVADKHILDETLRNLRYVFALSSLLSSGLMVSPNPSVSPCFGTLLWITIIPSRFCEMVEEKCPQALVIVAVYCILLKRVEEHWWIKGKAENLLDAIRRELKNGQWSEWLEWPIEEVGTESR
jgi:hypothetical protein